MEEYGIDTTGMCSHLQKKLSDPDGIYNPIWEAVQDDDELTVVVVTPASHI